MQRATRCGLQLQCTAISKPSERERWAPCSLPDRAMNRLTGYCFVEGGRKVLLIGMTSEIADVIPFATGNSMRRIKKDPKPSRHQH